VCRKADRRDRREHAPRLFRRYRRAIC
jgi:hypothetical protein